MSANRASLARLEAKLHEEFAQQEAVRKHTSFSAPSSQPGRPGQRRHLPASSKPAPATPAAPPAQPDAPAKPEPKYFNVPVKHRGTGPQAKTHYTFEKVPQSSVTDVPRSGYEIVQKGEAGPKGQIPTARIVFGKEPFNALGDADGNFYGGRMIRGRFVTQYRFVADPEEQAAIRQAKLDAEAAAQQLREEARAKERAESLRRTEEKARQKALELQRKLNPKPAAKKPAPKQSAPAKKK